MKLHWSPRNRSFGFIDGMGVTGLTGLLVARFVPVARLPFWGCALRKNTGWPCLGCGLTRAADRFSHGNILGALQANPLGTLLAAFFASCVLLSAIHLIFRTPVPNVEIEPREARWLRIALVVAIALNYAFVIVETRFPQLL
jgi:hypothetical protein